MRRWMIVLICIVLLAAAAVGLFLMPKQTEKTVADQLSPDEPQILTIWHYYNGAQQQTFDRLVLEFNETVGVETGIIIEAKSKGSVNDLTDALIASAQGAFGADPMPDMFAAYADTAYEVNKLVPLADLAPYFTQEELSGYIADYLEEGHLSGDDALMVFPIAKSTEILMLNRTEWYLFSSATGADADKLSTWEGVTELAGQYYEWTDSLTPDVPDDGRAFFGRDAFANYMIVGSRQLGVEIFEVHDGQLTLNVDAAVMRRLWDNYMVPYVSGHFAAYGTFRSDDVKTGRLAAIVCSTSGAMYFPTAVTRADGTTYTIAGECLPLPCFEGTEPYAAQQGAGMVVADTQVREYAATVFLKWFTGEANNLSFAVGSAYLPVKKSANSVARLDQELVWQGVSPLLRDSLITSAEMTTTYTLYTSDAFDSSYAARRVVDTHMQNAATAAVAQRDRLVAQGMSRAEAVDMLTNDEAFSRWYEEFKDALSRSVD